MPTSPDLLRATRPGHPARRPPRWRGVLRLVVLAGFLVALAWALAGQWGAVRPLLGRLSAASLAGALAAVAGGILATFLCWREVLAGLGARLPVGSGARVFFLGQLGKYLPGSLWPVMAQMELGRDHRVPERASASAVGVFLLLLVGTGLAVAAAAAPLLGSDAVHAYWWLLAILPLTLLVTVPPVLNRLLALGMRLARRWCPGWPMGCTSGCWPGSSAPLACRWWPGPPGRSRPPGAPGSCWW